MPRQDKAFSIIDMFRALGDETRLRILSLIGNQEICVCYFVEALKIGQPKISRHLAYLRRSGLVRARKDGKWVHYSLRVPSQAHAARILRETREWASQQHEFQRDQVRLAAARCYPERFIAIQEAPVPSSLTKAPRE